MAKSLEQQAIRKVFDSLDVDGSGSIDPDELSRGLKILKLPAGKKVVDSILAAADKDGDGSISYNEFCSYVAVREEEIRSVFAAIDVDGNGQLSVQEVRQSLLQLEVKATAAECSMLVNKMDKDGDGSISYPEFRDFLMLLPSNNVRAIFEIWTKAAAIDIGESMTIPDDAGSMKSPWLTLCAGAVSGAISRTGTAPLDRMKILMQASTGKFHHPGIMSSLHSIYSDGGWRSFFRGNGANVLKIAPESALKFWAFDTLKEKIAKDSHAPTPVERLMAGASAGAISQTVVYPLEIAKTRLAASKLGEYSGILQCLKNTITKEGIRGLYKGLGASVTGIIPYAGVDLALYSGLKEAYTASFPDREPGMLTLLACGAASSTAGQLVSYPLQLIRTRLQTQGINGRPILYTGMVDCFSKTLKEDGPTGLYRGLGPNFFKAVPAISISYVAFENVRVILEKKL